MGLLIRHHVYLILSALIRGIPFPLLLPHPQVSTLAPFFLGTIPGKKVSLLNTRCIFVIILLAEKLC
jgi:hypothetical protein